MACRRRQLVSFRQHDLRTFPPGGSAPDVRLMGVPRSDVPGAPSHALSTGARAVRRQLCRRRQSHTVLRKFRGRVYALADPHSWVSGNRVRVPSRRGPPVRRRCRRSSSSHRARLLRPREGGPMSVQHVRECVACGRGIPVHARGRGTIAAEIRWDRLFVVYTDFGGTRGIGKWCRRHFEVCLRSVHTRPGCE